MAGRGYYRDVQTTNHQSVCVSQPVRSRAVHRVGCPDGATQTSCQVRRPGRVVGMAVGEQHHRRVPTTGREGGGDCVEVGGVRRTRVDDNRLRRPGLAQDVGVGAVQRHRSGVRCQHTRDPLAEASAMPAALGRAGHDGRQAHVPSFGSSPGYRGSSGSTITASSPSRTQPTVWRAIGGAASCRPARSCT